MSRTSKHPRPDVAAVFGSPEMFIAFGFGSGLSPIAPGTAGTVVGLILYALLENLPFQLYLLLVAVLFGQGVVAAGLASKRLRVHDHPGIVWDEVVGYLVTMLGAPPGFGWMVLGFLLFRVFDIAKPWPIGWLDSRVDGGLGIMLDDLVAGLAAALVLHLLVVVL